MTPHPDQARVEGLIERLKAAKEVLRRAYGALYEIDAELRAINAIFDDADALSELLSLRASPSAGEAVEAFTDIMHALGRIHPGDRSRRIQKCMDLYEKMFPGVYDDEPGWTFIVHSLDDVRPVFPKAPSPSAVTREPSGLEVAAQWHEREADNARVRGRANDSAMARSEADRAWIEASVHARSAQELRAMLASTPEPETQPVEGWQAK